MQSSEPSTSNGQQTLSDTSNGLRKNMLEGDKLKNLKSVLHKKPAKNGSGSRQGPLMGERRPSGGGQRATVPRNVGASPMNFQNQRLLR